MVGELHGWASRQLSYVWEEAEGESESTTSHTTA